MNKGRIKPSYRLQAGDLVRVPPIRLEEPKKVSPNEKTLNNISESVLYEDKRFLILNKPRGLAVHGGSGLSFGLIEALRVLRPEAPFLELAHRLDRETSGCLLIAKKRSALRTVHELLRNNQIDKRYLALLKGEWTGGERNIEAPLRKNTLKSGERIVRVANDGKSALSRFRPLLVRAEASLVEVKLETGRTHQIRVHAAFAGHPIAGDEKYGDVQFNTAMKQYGLRRLFLHARSLQFEMPDDGQRINVQAPLSDELKTVLRNLDMRF